MSSITTILKKVLAESQELLYPGDLIEREPKPDFSFAFGRVRKIYTVCGLRRIGKTYYLYQLRKNLIDMGLPAEKTFYINMEDERIPKTTEVLTKLIPTIREMFGSGEIFLFIDEIHYIPNWSSWARRIHDEKKAHLFISGSTSKLSSENIPRELRGRSFTIRLFPLSFMDFLKFRSIKIDLKLVEWSEEKQALVKNLVLEYIKYGGLPEIVLVPKYKKIQLAQDYFRTIISRDIVEQFNVENRLALEDLLKLLVNSKVFSISKTYNVLKSLGHRIGKETVKRYIHYAKSIYFLDEVTIYSKTIKDQLMYPRKVYIADNIFITALAIKTDFGRLLENLLYIELKRRTYDNPLIRIHYWKNRTGAEVDFVVMLGTKPIKLIQTCWDPSDVDIRKREINALIRAGSELGIHEGIIVTYDYDGEEKRNGFKIRYIPIWKILLNITTLL